MCTLDRRISGRKRENDKDVICRNSDEFPRDILKFNTIVESYNLGLKF